MIAKSAPLLQTMALLAIAHMAMCGQTDPTNQLSSPTQISAKPSQANSTSSIQIEGGINAIFQDSKQRYWFGGSSQGVYCYNGQSLERFTSDHGLVSHNVFGIQEDSSGNLYFDTPSGISKYDGNQFTTLELSKTTATAKDWVLNSGDLWFRMGWDHKGPFRFNGKHLIALEFPESPQEKAFRQINPNASYNPYGIYSLYRDRKGTIWFGTVSLGICRFNGKTIDWLYESQLTNTPEGGEFGIRAMIQDQSGDFWFSNPTYRYQIEPDSKSPAKDSHIHYRRKEGATYADTNQQADLPYFLAVAEDNEGHLWMATYMDGVWQMKGNKLFHFPVTDQGKPIPIFSIYCDRSGNLWLGSQTKGVFVFNGTSFVKFTGSKKR